MAFLFIIEQQLLVVYFEKVLFKKIVVHTLFLFPN